MNDEELDALLRSAPRRATPPRDPWPGIEWEIAGKPRGSLVRVTAAAAVLCFLVGGLSGLAVGRSLGGVPSAGGGDLDASDAFLAAARVQSVGSVYLAALGQMHQLGVDHPGEDLLALAQGYESALAVAAVVAETVGSAPVAAPVAPELPGQVGLARAALGSRVARLLSAEEGR